MFFLCEGVIFFDMEISGEGIVLKVRAQSKGAYWLCLFTHEYGRLHGFVSGSRLAKGDLQIGNVLEFTHAKRVENQLGSFFIDVLKTPGAQNLNDESYMYILQYLCDLHERSLQEGQPLPNLYVNFLNMLEKRSENIWVDLVLFEMDFLKAMGYGLSLNEQDAIRGENDTSQLLYVSPKTGRAVSQHMGAPYQDKMLRLPYVFGGESKEVLDLFKLTGHFLQIAFDGEVLQSRQSLIQIAKEMNFGESKP